MKKAELRQIYLEKRSGILAEDHAALSQNITEKVFDELNIRQIGSVHCFISLEHRGEVETEHIFDRLWGDFPHIQTFAPRVDNESGEMVALPYGRDTRLEQNRWHILEPQDGERADPSTIDVVVVPLLCFDVRGHRVGYGKGYYDRFLKKCRPDCIKAGLSFFPPVERIDDIHEGDLALDICVTPSRIFRFSPI